MKKDCICSRGNDRGHRWHSGDTQTSVATQHTPPVKWKHKWNVMNMTTHQITDWEKEGMGRVWYGPFFSHCVFTLCASSQRHSRVVVQNHIQDLFLCTLFA